MAACYNSNADDVIALYVYLASRKPRWLQRQATKAMVVSGVTVGARNFCSSSHITI